MEEIYWEYFFNNAGIGGIASKEYASIFVKNKISDSLLVHLNENYLKSMSICAIGDIIRILKYTKDYLNEKNSPYKTTKEAKEILPVSDLFKGNVSISDRMFDTATYVQPFWFHHQAPLTRIILPKVEYPITYSHCPSVFITEQDTSMDFYSVPDDSDETDRIVILGDSSQLDLDKTSVLNRLGHALDRCSQSSSSDHEDNDYGNEDEDEDYCPDAGKRLKIETPDNKTLLRRFFHASLSRDSTTNIHLSKKITINHKTGRVRPLNTSDDSLPYIGVFKTPDTKKGIKIRRGQTTENLQKMEATSTTECGSLKSDLIVISSTSRNVRNRLGQKW